MPMWTSASCLERTGHRKKMCRAISKSNWPSKTSSNPTTPRTRNRRTRRARCNTHNGTRRCWNKINGIDSLCKNSASLLFNVKPNGFLDGNAFYTIKKCSTEFFDYYCTSGTTNSTSCTNQRRFCFRRYRYETLSQRSGRNEEENHR